MADVSVMVGMGFILLASFIYKKNKASKEKVNLND